MHRFQRWALNPWTVLGCVLAGGALGWAAPAFSKHLGVIGIVYVDLLKMIVLPFMISAVIFSLQSLYRDGGAGRIIKSVIIVFIAISLVTAVLSAAGSLLFRPGSNLPAATLAALGDIVSIDANQTNTEMSLRTPEAPPKELSLQDILQSLIPSNIFASLANGETLKALVFALLFGFAVGQVPTRMSTGLNHALETIYVACETLTHWVNLPIPFILICMTASQIAETGLEPLKAMAGFVAAFLVICVILLALAMTLIGRRANVPLKTVVAAMREPFALGVATNNSATCMPAMVSGLVNKLNFARSRVELLVPLSISLLRMGPVAYYICGTLFIAALYGRPVSAVDVGLLMLVSIMLGFASAGMAGIVTISLIGTTCSYLGLPFEAVFLLFAAVDPVCAMARTVVTVISGCAAVSVICPKPVQL
ncbi:dicarboxylate/amino acid:cation symporter [Noviherbaspirillum sp. Root189]|uniref:dicarboxylate/amino acid:cation symporter n=1 Tax=Noviherbaspirillum sp. Root189 TaxID=1736487 RepID=UPI000708D592|nr:cation:dicarboxylase symporter family transporter [Noviherbaspirillum sp. Root189]KRB67892.1 sodium:dicarboxylate symporter [Noviherbaspirillum sp. Root189]